MRTKLRSCRANLQSCWRSWFEVRLRNLESCLKASPDGLEWNLVERLELNCESKSSEKLEALGASFDQDGMRRCASWVMERGKEEWALDEQIYFLRSLEQTALSELNWRLENLGIKRAL